MEIISKDFHKYNEEWWNTLYSKHTHVSSDTEIKNHEEVSIIIGDGSVIDFGCGHGYFSQYVNGRYLGIDWSEKAIEKARELFKEKDFISANFKDVSPNVEGTFDYAVAFEIFEHLEDPKELISKMLEFAPVAIFALPKDNYSQQTADSDKPLLSSLGIQDTDYHYANYSKEDITSMFPNAEVKIKDIDFIVTVKRG